MMDLINERNDFMDENVRIERGKVMEQINQMYFLGIMSPKWYGDIDTMFNTYGFSNEIMAMLFEYCHKRNALNTNYVLAVAKTWYNNDVKTKRAL